jgi:hypothetical protein
VWNLSKRADPFRPDHRECGLQDIHRAGRDETLSQLIRREFCYLPARHRVNEIALSIEKLLEEVCVRWPAYGLKHRAKVFA